MLPFCPSATCFSPRSPTSLTVGAAGEGKWCMRDISQILLARYCPLSLPLLHPPSGDLISNILILLSLPIFFLSALLLLFFSFFLLFLAFCLTSGMKFYACLIRLVGVKRGPAFCQSMCWDTEAILKLPLMVVFNSPCISNSIEELCPCSIKGQSTHGEYSTEWFPKQLDSCTYPKLPQEMELLSTTRRRKKRML